MSAFKSLENNFDELFVKKAPALPPGGKRALVEYLPWINLVLGVFTLYAAYGLWHWAHIANSLINYANSWSAAYGGPKIATNQMTIGLWLGLVVLIIEGLIYLAAFPATRARKKSGWDLLFYALLINVAYGVIVAFTSYGGIGSLIWTIIGSAIGLYLLFQIRSSYLRAPAAKKAS